MIGNYRYAKHTVTLDTAVALAKALDLTVDQLSGACPLPDPPPPHMPEVVVDGVRYVPEAPHHAPATDAGSDPADRPAATPSTAEPAGDLVLPQPRGRTRRARRKSPAPSPDE